MGEIPSVFAVLNPIVCACSAWWLLRQRPLRRAWRRENGACEVDAAWPLPQRFPGFHAFYKSLSLEFLEIVNQRLFVLNADALFGMLGHKWLARRGMGPKLCTWYGKKRTAGTMAHPAAR